MSFAVYNQGGNLKRVSAYYNDKGTIKHPKDMKIVKNIGGRLVNFPHPEKLVCNLDIVSWTNTENNDAMAWMPTPSGFEFPNPMKVLTGKDHDINIDQQGVIPGYAFYSNRINGILTNPHGASIFIGRKFWNYDFTKNLNMGDPKGSLTLSFYVKFKGTPKRDPGNKSEYYGHECRLICIGGLHFLYFIRMMVKYIGIEDTMEEVLTSVLI